MKKLILLGASGSIGKQTLEVLEKYPNLFSLEAFSVGYNNTDVSSIIEKFNPKAVFLFDEEYTKQLKNKYNTLEVYLFGIDENVKSYIEDANQMKGIK